MVVTSCTLRHVVGISSKFVTSTRLILPLKSLMFTQKRGSWSRHHIFNCCKKVLFAFGTYISPTFIKTAPLGGTSIPSLPLWPHLQSLLSLQLSIMTLWLSPHIVWHCGQNGSCQNHLINSGITKLGLANHVNILQNILFMKQPITYCQQLIFHWEHKSIVMEP